MKLRQVAKIFLVAPSLFALLIASLPGLTESLAASDLPACCNTAYCPVHHRQAQQLQKDKSICDSKVDSAGNSCSMRACDTTPSPALGTAPFILSAPLDMRGPASAEPARVQASQFFHFITSIPLTPPPRTLPS
jgi:hypothetical protein